MDDDMMEETGGHGVSPEGRPNDSVDLAITILRAPVLTDARAFDAKVLQAIRQPVLPRVIPSSPASSWSRARSWTAIAAIAASVVFAVALNNLVERHDDTATRVSRVAQTTHSVPMQTVQFRLTYPNAQRVAVVGSFNGWDLSATPLRHIGGDIWVADIPLSAGRYVYQFVVNGHKRVPDPLAPNDPADDFGATNSVLTVVSRGAA